MASALVEQKSRGPNAIIAFLPTTLASVSTSKLIVLDVNVDGVARPLRALLDTGASNNFIRSKCLEGTSIEIPSSSDSSDLIVRLADGTQLTVPKSSITLRYSLEELQGQDDFILLDLDDRFDIILGLPWCRRHQPNIDWENYCLQFPSSSSSLDVNTSSIEDQHDGVPSRPVSDGPAQQDSPTTPIRNRFDCLDECEDDSGLPEDVCAVNSHSQVLDTMSKPSSNEGQVHKRTKRKKKVFTPGPGKPLSKMPIRNRSYSTICSIYMDGERSRMHSTRLENPPTSAAALTSYPTMEYDEFVLAFNSGDITQVCVLVAENDPQVDEPATHQSAPSSEVTLATSSQMDLEVLDDKTRKERYESQTWESLKSNPVYDIIKEHEDVFPDEVPSELPVDRGIRHEIDLEPGTKYCVTRQWPLPREQVEAIDKFFESRRKAGHVRESNSPHCSPTFCVKKATGGWRIVHAFNKLNDATIPAQTPVPRKDMIVDNMSGSTQFSSMDLMDGFYQTLMRVKDVPLTAVSTPSGMLWEWLVMPQGLKNAPATFNRMVSHVLRPFRHFAPSYFDDVFIHSKAQDGKTDLEVHREHLRAVLGAMRKNKLYANLKKCVFAAPEIPVLGCIVGRHGVRPDPEKVKAISEWPVPQNVKQLRQFLGLANYMHKYSRNYAALARPLTQLLRDDLPWQWLASQQDVFDAIKRSLQEAPILALPDYDRPFHVVCDAS